MFAVTEIPDELRAEIGEIIKWFTPAQGATSQVLTVRGRKGQFVVKRSVGEQWSAWVAREYAILRMLVGMVPMVPQVVGFVTRTTQRGPEAWLLTEWMPGRTVRQVLSGEHNRQTRESVVRSWARSLASLHATLPIDALATPDSWLDEQLRQARYNLEHFGCDGDEKLLQWLERERPDAAPVALIHGDFTVDNTLIDNGVVFGIIDWAAGAMGDPRYDLALATELRPPVFGERDIDIFWDAYGRSPIHAEERVYFEGLYEFF